MSVKNRLSRLEKATAGTKAAQEAYAARANEEQAEREAAWAIMEQTMSEGHERLVVEAYAAGAHDVRSPEFNTPAGRLLRRCLDAISRLKYRHWPDTEIAAGVVLAMPPVLAEVYLAQDVLPLHECEDCGCHLPHEYFKTCPLCGGHVGWYAFWEKHKDDAGDRTIRGPAVH